MMCVCMCVCVCICVYVCMCVCVCVCVYVYYCAENGKVLHDRNARDFCCFNHCATLRYYFTPSLAVYCLYQQDMYIRIHLYNVLYMRAHCMYIVHTYMYS
jgi:hypothetical protein